MAAADGLGRSGPEQMLAFLLDEPVAADVERELRDASRTAWISAINLAEIVDVMTRIYSRSPKATLESGR